ncbi:MAG TPA: lipid-A-disaccharide synthase [Candidatus Deferrimicrobiaceae bacterium]|nr:lipid-A-disaccharide synthase [Candidatus Deferrimicrobiaceae bacterium]
MSPGNQSLFILCGEPSGEAYAASVARAFRRRYPGVPMEGIGSSALESEGVRLFRDYGSISVVGILEVVRHLPAVVSALRDAKRRVGGGGVGALLLVDFPDFNFRVGREAHRRGVPVIYYVPPQLWAWRVGRARELAAFTKGVVVPFPFEVPILEESGVNVRFAGHPLLDELAPVLDAPPDPARFGIPPGKRVVGLLPGSRSGEIRAHLPVLTAAARRISDAFPDVHFAVPLASPRFRDAVDRELLGKGLPVAVVDSGRHLLLRGMFTAAAASGTATLELALLGVPPVIVYRTSALTYWIGKRMAKVSSIGLPNLVAGEPFLPELLQEDCNPERVAGEICALLADPARRDALAARCRSLRAALSGPGPSEAVVDMLAAEAGEAWG